MNSRPLKHKTKRKNNSIMNGRGKSMPKTNAQPTHLSKMTTKIKNEMYSIIKLSKIFQFKKKRREAPLYRWHRLMPGQKDKDELNKRRT